tara:strand:+ start:80 stop:898 length:819 start_codon:yes stop_codon:yes gene_type:complete
MTHVYKFCFIFLLIFTNLFSQDLYNLENTLKFADYLKNKGELSFALEEYNRAYFLSPANKKIHNEILLINRKLKLYKSSLDFIEKIEFSRNIKKEELYVLTKLKKYEKLDFELQRKNLNINDLNFFKTSLFILKDDWLNADEYILNLNANEKNKYINEYTDIIKQHNKLKNKNPYLAGTFSLLVPGLGKLYTGDTKDAIYSFLTICLGAWQATNSFAKSGLQSTTGWIYGGMTLFLYSGNIYGSYSSARKYNKNQKKVIDEKINHNIDNFMY